VAGSPARWGFHELTEQYARRIVASADIRPGDLVVDVGAGRGRLVGPLLEAGARVVALELHPHRAAALRARFTGERIHVVQTDLRTWRLPRREYRIVANPPFAVVAELLRRTTARHSRLASADLVVPAYVAARWARGAGYSADCYAASTIRRLPTDAFRPAATQAVSVLRLQRR
jgi:23S rRNA (adenine-N6)-dimethyltransferase